MRRLRFGAALCLWVLLAGPFSGCGQKSGEMLSYDEFSVYQGGSLLASAPDAVSAVSRYEGFSAIGAHLGQNPEQLSTLRGARLGTTLEDLERLYGDVEFWLLSPRQQGPKPLDALLRDIDPYGEITLQTVGYFSFAHGTPEVIDLKTYEKQAEWGENVQLLKLNFVLQNGNVQDIELFVKAVL